MQRYAFLRIGELNGFRCKRNVPLSCCFLKSHMLALTTSCRDYHKGKTSLVPPKGQELVVDVIETCVPTTFTSVSMVFRNTPPELVASIPGRNHVGLYALCAQYPHRFECKKIGDVHVVRRLVQRGSSSAPPPSFINTSTNRGRHAAPSSGTKSQQHSEALVQLVPSFPVPVSALKSEWNRQSLRQVKSILARHHLLLRYVNPFDMASSVVEDAKEEMTDGGKEDNSVAVRDTLLLKGFVCLTSQPRWSKLMMEMCRQTDERLSQWRVEDYEQFRVARLFHEANVPTPITAAMDDDAMSLLPPGHTLLHVLASAPELFSFSYDSGQDHHENQQFDSANSGIVADEAATPASCTFLLNNQYRLKFSESREQLLHQLEDIQRSGDQSLKRRRKRTLSRKLQYLTCCSPLFDERVFAQLVLDTLPTQGSLHVSACVKALPREAHHCMPTNINAFLSRFPRFFLTHADPNGGTQVQRADVPLPELRTASDVGTEEILQILFNRYPRRRPPEQGTCLARCLPILPKVCVDRLFSMTNVVDELLSKYPDKIEVLGSSAASADTAEERAHLNTSSRGRDDFVVYFRFVGEWQERLCNRYERYCAKHKIVVNADGV